MQLNFVAGTRGGLAEASDSAACELSRSGSWLDGNQRAAIAGEARNAWDCRLCQDRKEALSPYMVDGVHDQHGTLPSAWVEAIHRIVTDSGRITGAWYESIIGEDLCEDEFIELLSVTCITTSLDVLARACGSDPFKIAEPLPGVPPRERPGGARPGPGWASTVAPEEAGPELGDFYDLGPFYIRRALTLVPEEANRFWNLMNELYLPDPAAEGLGNVQRGLTRAQIEFLAARVSALLGCYY